MARFGYFLSSEEHPLPQRAHRRLAVAAGGRAAGDSGGSGRADAARARATALRLWASGYLTQIGPEQDGFFDFYSREVLPRLRG
jgi:hypothetical protein